MAETTPDKLRWLAGVTDADLQQVGIGNMQSSEQTPQMVLAQWANAYNVDLTKVHDCLTLLSSGPFLLHVGAPLAFAVYSPRRQLFRVSFDTDCSIDLANWGLTTTGAWLAVLAAEAGELPNHPEHWSILRLESTGMCGCNQSAVDQYRQYAHMAAATPVSDFGPDSYDQQVSQAVWRCASYALR
jgi:hypothetical protein